MLDTSSEAAEAQAAVHRRLGGVQKLLIACEMSDLIRQVAQDRIRREHPELSDEQVVQKLIGELYGIDPKR